MKNCNAFPSECQWTFNNLGEIESLDQISPRRSKPVSFSFSATVLPQRLGDGEAQRSK